MEDTTSSTGYHRPRRPASDTIAYLRGLPLDIDTAHQEVSRFLSSSSSKVTRKDIQNNEQDNNNNEDDDDEDDNVDDDFPQSLAAAFSALDEVKSEIASLAGDEYGSQSIEILTRIAAPYSEIASRILLNACKGYYLHLTTHRYGSHVLQTILQLSMVSIAAGAGAGAAADKNDLALHEEAPPSLKEEDENNMSLPSLYELIIGVVDELSPHITELAVHLCGSHVVRTLLCVLGGVTLESSRHDTSNSNNKKQFDMGGTIRGRLKPKKKKKKKKPSSSDDSSSSSSSTPQAGTMTIVYQTNSRIEPNKFQPTLESLSQALLGERSAEPGELQQHACHASAGPLLIVLIRVLTYSTDSARNEFLKLSSSKSKTKQPLEETAKINANSSIADFRLGIPKSEPRYNEGSLADNAVKQILCWQEGNDASGDQQHAHDVIYGLSGEPRGSHVLETIMRLCPDEFYESLLKYGNFLSAQAMQDYVDHNVSNFVVQTMLSTVRNKDQAESVLKTVEKIISTGLTIDSTKKRQGILWRATELAAKYRIEQDGILKSIRLGFLAINNNVTAPVDATNNEIDDNNDNDNSEGGKKKKKRKKASAVDFKDCIPMLIGLKRNPVDDQRITLDVAGCRSVHHMLRFSPRLCEDVLEGIIKGMSVEDLISITKDGLGSRCIMDGILDGPVKTPIFANATNDLREKLAGHWSSLATDRVGHHTVKKLFKSLPRIDDKAKLVEELLEGGNRLRGNTMGRSVIEACAVDVYDENRKEWRHKVGRMLSSTEESFLAEVTHDRSTTKAAATTTEGEETITTVATATTKTKAKRKRRRKRATDDTDLDNDSESRKSQKSSSSSGITMESIMDVMNVGNN